MKSCPGPPPPGVPPVGAQEPPPRAAPPLVRTLRVTREPLLCTGATGRGLAVACRSREQVEMRPASGRPDPGSGWRPTTSAKPEAEHPGGSFAPVGPPTRAKGAAVQVSRICSALPRHACRRPQHVQSSTLSDLPPNAAPLPSRGDAAMAGSDEGRLTVVRLEKHYSFVTLP
jgi:hypothetical protein